MSDRIDHISRELRALQDDDGRINAAGAVKWARKHTKSHLHAALEWDDAIAGEQYRIWQVRSLINVHIVDSEGSRQLVSLTIDRRDGGYRPIEDVLSTPDLRKVMLDDALADLQRLERKYQRLQELAEVWAARARVERRR